MDLNELLSYSLDSGASDLHLSVGSVPMVRINGSMRPLNIDALSQDDMESMLTQVMNEDQKKLFHGRKEIDFSAKLDGKGRFRVNFFNQINGLAGVFRTIPDTIKDLDDLCSLLAKYIVLLLYLFCLIIRMCNKFTFFAFLQKS